MGKEEHLCDQICRQFCEPLKPFFDRIKVMPLSKLTTYKIGGEARVFFPRSEEDLIDFYMVLWKTRLPFKVIGGGSNLLVSDHGLKELVISMPSISAFFVREQGNKVIIYSEAGMSLPTLIGITSRLGYSGLEELAGIPASVGGAVINNAGAYGREIGELIKSVKFLEPLEGLTALRAKDIHFEYRSSSLKYPGVIILGVELELVKSDSEKTMRRFQEILRKRRETQPLQYPSCGSVFKNPPGHKAWQLIDKAGFRGYRIGDAAVSEKHTNFIVNLGKAKASHVYELIKRIKSEVKSKFGIALEEEVELWGEFED